MNSLYEKNYITNDPSSAQFQQMINNLINAAAFIGWDVHDYQNHEPGHVTVRSYNSKFPQTSPNRCKISKILQ